MLCFLVCQLLGGQHDVCGLHCVCPPCFVYRQRHSWGCATSSSAFILWAVQNWHNTDGQSNVPFCEEYKRGGEKIDEMIDNACMQMLWLWSVWVLSACWLVLMWLASTFCSPYLWMFVHFYTSQSFVVHLSQTVLQTDYFTWCCKCISEPCPWPLYVQYWFIDSIIVSEATYPYWVLDACSVCILILDVRMTNYMVCMS